MTSSRCNTDPAGKPKWATGGNPDKQPPSNFQYAQLHTRVRVQRQASADVLRIVHLAIAQTNLGRRSLIQPVLQQHGPGPADC